MIIKKLGIILSFFLVFLLYACGGGAGTNSSSGGGGVTPASIISVNIEPGNSIVTLSHNSIKLSLMAYYSDSTSHALSNVTWSVSDNSLAIIDASGTLTAIKVGLVVVTAVSQNKTYKTNLTIINATLQSITLMPKNQIVPVGTVVDYDAIGHFSSGVPDYPLSNVKFSTSDSKINIIDSNTGVAIGKNKGTAQISVQDVATGIISTTTLQVTNSPLQFITIESSTKEIKVGTKTILHAYAHYLDGTSGLITPQWSISLNPGLATIESNGLLTAIGTGTIEVRASFLGFKAAQTVNILNPKIVSLRIESANLNLPIGLSYQLKAIAHFESGFPDAVVNNVTWVSDNNLVNIDSTGMVIASKDIPLCVLNSGDPKCLSGLEAKTPVLANISVKVIGDEMTKASSVINVDHAVISKIRFSHEMYVPLANKEQILNFEYSSSNNPESYLAIGPTDQELPCNASFVLDDGETMITKCTIIDSSIADFNDNKTLVGKKVGITTMHYDVFAGKDTNYNTISTTLGIVVDKISNIVLSPLNTVVTFYNQQIQTQIINYMLAITYNDGTVRDVTFSPFTTFASSNPKITFLTNTSQANVPNVASGESSTIVATYAGQSSIAQMIVQLDVNGVELQPTNQLLDFRDGDVFKTVDYTVKIHYKDGSTTDVTNDANTKFTSSNPKINFIKTKAGEIIVPATKTFESTVITVTYLGKSNTTVLSARYVAPVITRIQIQPDRPLFSCAGGTKSVQLVVTAYYDNNTQKDVTNQVQFGVDDPQFYITASGLLMTTLPAVNGTGDTTTHTTNIYTNFAGYFSNVQGTYVQCRAVM